MFNPFRKKEDPFDLSKQPLAKEVSEEENPSLESETTFALKQRQNLHEKMKDSKLLHDSFNNWAGNISTLRDSKSQLEKVKPVKHYEDYYRNSKSKTFDNAFTNTLMILSDLGAIKEFDQLADDFNAILDECKTKQDPKPLLRIAYKAKALIYGEELDENGMFVSDTNKEPKY